MSRIGKEPVTIPAGVTVDVKEREFIVKGPLGTLVQDYDPAITIKVEGGVATLTRANDLGPVRAKHGLYRALLFNMVNGVTKGFEKVLVVNGVGWKVAMQGKKLVTNVGYSHPVEMDAPEGITYETPDANTIIIKGIDKQLVGQMAAVIRSKRAPEPYKGKGIKYEGEKIRRKAGKTGK